KPAHHYAGRAACGLRRRQSEILMPLAATLLPLHDCTFAEGRAAAQLPDLGACGWGAVTGWFAPGAARLRGARPTQDREPSAGTSMPMQSQRAYRVVALGKACSRRPTRRAPASTWHPLA